MTVDFPVMSPVCYIFHLKVVTFCLKYGKFDVSGRIGAYLCLVSIEGGRGQDLYFYGKRSYDRFIHSQSIKLVHDLALY